MASGAQGLKQSRGYFVTLATLGTDKQFTSASSGGAGGSFLPGTMTAADSTTASIAAGCLLKDMGKTVVSSTHTFRKVQAVITGGPNIVSTGVTTGAGATGGRPFYIELVTGQNAQSTAASVAYLPGLM